MTILYDNGDKPYRHPSPYDADNKMFYSRSYRPKTWAANTESIEDEDIVIPTIPNGFMYECISGGRTGSSEPSFLASSNKKTVDGQVQWKAIPYSLLLKTGDIITNSTWVGTNSETIDNEAIVNNIQTKFRLTGVVAGSTTATIINHVFVLRANGDIEEFDKTMIITIKEL